MSIVPLILVGILYCEAMWTHQLLSELRSELLKGIRECPTDTRGAAASAGH